MERAVTSEADEKWLRRLRKAHDIIHFSVLISLMFLMSRLVALIEFLTGIRIPLFGDPIFWDF